MQYSISNLNAFIPLTSIGFLFIRLIIIIKSLDRPILTLSLLQYFVFTSNNLR